MIITVKAVASARKTASQVCWPRFLNASCGPYADEESPSAPSPTQARNAISEMCRKSWGSPRSRGLPSKSRFRRCAERGLGGSRGDFILCRVASSAPAAVRREQDRRSCKTQGGRGGEDAFHKTRPAGGCDGAG